MSEPTVSVPVSVVRRTVEMLMVLATEAASEIRREYVRDLIGSLEPDPDQARSGEEPTPFERVDDLDRIEADLRDTRRELEALRAVVTEAVAALRVMLTHYPATIADVIEFVVSDRPDSPEVWGLGKAQMEDALALRALAAAAATEEGAGE
jgi:hypothetical protein